MATGRENIPCPHCRQYITHSHAGLDRLEKILGAKLALAPFVSLFRTGANLTPFLGAKRRQLHAHQVAPGLGRVPIGACASVVGATFLCHVCSAVGTSFSLWWESGKYHCLGNG